ncbi:glutathione S-transferase family protein [Sneathiella marina]|uniref:Glutathione S-transferase family protein n=1 Tax=Sneathiella marina TaxID=2950108 RepID=A0ABY4W3S0_9PROT|nr:glutathione S-transferase family protein [Sneathiella marina]USG61612.1 glutathione S-transferase family protein [Sneathiella marina]
MGRLIDGEWVAKGVDPRKSSGKFNRTETQFRNWIQADNSSEFPAEKNRYHLFVSHACPWAHRTMIFRKLLGLEDIISVTYVEPMMLENGWEIRGSSPIEEAKFMYHVYQAAEPFYSGQASVPVLWDKQKATIVSNESSEIIRMLNNGFKDLSNSYYDFYPQGYRAEIDVLNDRIYHTLNNGVYKCGFARQAEPYVESFDLLFETLDWLEEKLSHQRYLLKYGISEADWRLFTTLVRFDAVYHGHFKCNLRRLIDYPDLSNYLRDLYQVPGIADTVELNEIKTHYYGSHDYVNPSRIVPKGPLLDFMAPHNRARFE